MDEDDPDPADLDDIPIPDIDLPQLQILFIREIPLLRPYFDEMYQFLQRVRRHVVPSVRMDWSMRQYNEERVTINAYANEGHRSHNNEILNYTQNSQCQLYSIAEHPCEFNTRRTMRTFPYYRRITEVTIAYSARFTGLHLSLNRRNQHQQPQLHHQIRVPEEQINMNIMNIIPQAQAEPVPLNRFNAIERILDYDINAIPRAVINPLILLDLRVYYDNMLNVRLQNRIPIENINYARHRIHDFHIEFNGRIIEDVQHPDNIIDLRMRLRQQGEPLGEGENEFLRFFQQNLNAVLINIQNLIAHVQLRLNPNEEVLPVQPFFNIEQNQQFDHAERQQDENDNNPRARNERNDDME